MQSPTYQPPRKSSPIDSLLIDAKRAAAALSISERTLWQKTAELEIPSVRIGRRNLYSPEALRAWIAAKSTEVD